MSLERSGDNSHKPVPEPISGPFPKPYQKAFAALPGVFALACVPLPWAAQQRAFRLVKTKAARSYLFFVNLPF